MLGSHLILIGSDFINEGQLPMARPVLFSRCCCRRSNAGENSFPSDAMVGFMLRVYISRSVIVFERLCLVVELAA